ncbi:MAG: hypothetical protein KDD54_10150 [Flavobacteriales bacterium]|nr:hypothetical protein [Flavobacteriales bacterium]
MKQLDFAMRSAFVTSQQHTNMQRFRQTVLQGFRQHFAERLGIDNHWTNRNILSKSVVRSNYLWCTHGREIWGAELHQRNRPTASDGPWWLSKYAYAGAMGMGVAFLAIGKDPDEAGFELPASAKGGAILNTLVALLDDLIDESPHRDLVIETIFLQENILNADLPTPPEGSDLPLISAFQLIRTFKRYVHEAVERHRNTRALENLSRTLSAMLDVQVKLGQMKKSQSHDSMTIRELKIQNSVLPFQALCETAILLDGVEGEVLPSLASAMGKHLCLIDDLADLPDDLRMGEYNLYALGELPPSPWEAISELIDNLMALLQKIRIIVPRGEDVVWAWTAAWLPGDDLGQPA